MVQLKKEGLQTTAESAFQGCVLEHITFPSTVTKVGNGAFYNCKELKEALPNEELQDTETMHLVGASCRMV